MPVFHRETSVSVGVEDIAAASGGNGGWLTTFLVLAGLFVAGAVAAKKWVFPYTIEDLESQVRSIDALIKKNMRLDCNILGDSAPCFRQMLERQVNIMRDNQVRRIRTNTYAEPDKTRIVAWISFQWSQLCEIKACYLNLQELQWTVTLEVEEQTRSLHTNNNWLLGPWGPRVN
ncbi:hypothetical protein L218DRAFT_946980 [Marasmius fiardii PR-910]|nr:hypothetical protein L218DRAFT_946980 [Marasmius fiardii PR-910]